MSLVTSPPASSRTRRETKQIRARRHGARLRENSVRAACKSRQVDSIVKASLATRTRSYRNGGDFNDTPMPLRRSTQRKQWPGMCDAPPARRLPGYARIRVRDLAATCAAHRSASVYSEGARRNPSNQVLVVEYSTNN